MRQDLKYLGCLFLGAATGFGWWLADEMGSPPAVLGIVATMSVLAGAWVLVTVFEWLRRKP